jgi:hypothetical protein
MNFTEIKTTLKSMPLGAKIYVISFIVALLILLFFVINLANSSNKQSDLLLTPEQKLLKYAADNSCTRTKLAGGVVWWICANGWWEEIELFHLANGEYRVDGTEQTTKTSPAHEEN